MIERLSAALADRYRIVREIGAGGMATVYLAEDLKHGREVALKVLRPELAATMGPERFFREIQVAARLQHPHILPLHDSGEAEGFLYFVMPYVMGESLRERLSRLGELPIPDVVRILTQVADALSYSHSQGVVHRDIKPDNVMLSGRHALVTDFGVAKAVSEATGRDGLTTAGVALGTPTYMAPEQATADPLLDHRVDIYAMGILGYEMLTGRPPFEGLSPQQMLVAHVTETPRAVRQLREACPSELEAAIMRCLAKRPADRWQSADELLAVLEPLAASSGGVTPTQSRPTSAEPRVSLPAAPQRRGWAIAAVAVVVAGAAVWAGSRGDRAAEQIAYGSLTESRVTTSGWTTSAASAPDLQRVAYAERVCSRESSCTLQLKVQDITGAGVATLASGFTWIGDVQWSADGRWLVVVGTYEKRFGVYAMPSLGGSLRFVGCCLATPTRRGDTVIVSDFTRVSDGATPFRYVTLRDGRDVGRVPIAPALGNQALGLELTPERLLVVAATSGQAVVAVQDRQGILLDSMRFSLSGFEDFGVTTESDGFWFAQRDTLREDRVNLWHHSVTSDGRIVRVPDRVITGLPDVSDVHISPQNGALTLSYGPREYAVWTGARATPAATGFPLTVVERATAPVTGTIAPDGETLLMMRSRASDARTRDLALRRFGDGNERPLGAFEDISDWDWFPDSERMLLFAKQPDSDVTQVAALDVRTGAREPLGDEPGFLIEPQTLPNGSGWVALRDFGNYLVVRGSGIGPDTAFTPPPAMNAFLVSRPLADGRTLVVAGWSLTSDSVLVGRLSLQTGRFERMGAFTAEGTGGIALMPNGDLLLQLWESSSSHRFLLWQAASASWRDLGAGPQADATYRFSVDGRRVVVRAAVRRGDVYVVQSEALRGVAAR